MQASNRRISRRSLLKFAGAAGLGTLPFAGVPRVAADTARSKRFLFVVTAYGGAGILDSFLPIVESDVASPDTASKLTVYPEAWVSQPTGSNLRSVRNLSAEAPPSPPFRAAFDMPEFLASHAADTLVMTVENSSVNHQVGQQRAVTGDSVDGGRTIMEAFATTYGEGLQIPNINLSSGGYAHAGIRDDTPDFARGVLVVDPQRFALSTHGFRGVAGAPSEAAIERARVVRGKLETASPLAPLGSAARQRFLQQRESAYTLEASDLVNRLLLVGTEDEEGGVSDEMLDSLGLARSPEFEALAGFFPSMTADPVYSRAALAFLLAKYGVSSTVTFGPGVVPRVKPGGETAGSPLAFDLAHTQHLLGQNTNWCHLMGAVDGLIRALKSEPHGDGSMWDSSLIYVATEFGRGKERPAGADFWQYGTPHDLNNGVVLVSPLLRGNRVYGGVNFETGLTYGFDPLTGDPRPDQKMSPRHVYSAIAQALDIDFAGRVPMDALVR